MGTAGSKHRSKKNRPKSSPAHAGKGNKAQAENYRPISHSDPQIGEGIQSEGTGSGNVTQPGQQRSPKQDTSEDPTKGKSPKQDTSEVPTKEKGTGTVVDEKQDPVKDSAAKEQSNVTGPEAGLEADMADQRQHNRSFSMEPTDIMISYSHQDKEQMRQIRDALVKAGITVWVDEIGLKAGVEFFNKIGQAIVDAKLFLTLLSTRSVVSKYCKDELALAYISSKPIFPCAIEGREEMIALMDFGMRLQLAPVAWTTFTDSTAFNQSIIELIQKIQSKLMELDAEKSAAQSAKQRHKFQRQRSHLNLHSTPSFEAKKAIDFWEKNFKGQASVEWERFQAAFLEDYRSDLDEMFKSVDQHWLLAILSNELDEDSDGLVEHQHYDEFCTVNGSRSEFWLRVQEHALESYTMREVFSMDSTVRIDAIQNLSKFHSNSVLEALLDLCSDENENVRAVAALSLARVADPQNKHAVSRMMNLLKDKDRLVRESGCLALGHIKAEEAVPKLVNLWRNDAISNVREAAQIALEKIGGEEAKQAIHITKVLSDEIKKLAEKT